jgi:hypothetical protein
MDTTPEQRHAFPEFANTRHAARAADKAAALGQIYFRVFFEHVDVATVFMMEVAALLTTDSFNGRPVMLIDNTGWDDTMMSGSGCSTRYLMGRPSSMESGPPAVWRIRRAKLASWGSSSQEAPLPDELVGQESTAAGAEGGHDGCIITSAEDAEVTPQKPKSWWLCQLALRGRKVQVAVLPGEVCTVKERLTGLLHQMRTCTPSEKAMMAACRMESLEVMWL